MFNLIRRLSFQELFRLTMMLIRNPLYVIPTLNATRGTLKICEVQYGRKHHGHGKANAFRHALWNLLICKKVYQINTSVQKSTAWAKKITDLHEELSPNEDPLEKAMDLHNNDFGRNLFDSLKTYTISEMVIFLKEKTKQAVRIYHVDEVSGLELMVYMAEE